MDDLRLGIGEMDEKHQDFLDLLKQIQEAGAGDFMRLFEQMIKHTKEHFDFEEALMREHAFYAIQEHLDEHANLLGEMEHFYEKAKKMRQFGISYINHYAFEKFRRHIINIDSQLAMFLKDQG